MRTRPEIRSAALRLAKAVGSIIRLQRTLVVGVRSPGFRRPVGIFVGVVAILLQVQSFALGEILESPALTSGSGGGPVAAGFEPERKIQVGLKALGYYKGPIDGHLGPATRKAIGKFQSSVGLAATGDITDEFKTRFNSEARAIDAVREYMQKKGCTPVNPLVMKCPAGEIRFNGFPF